MLYDYNMHLVLPLDLSLIHLFGSVSSLEQFTPSYTYFWLFALLCCVLNSRFKNCS